MIERTADFNRLVRDFFLGGRKLPWWAVSGSIVVSAITSRC